MLSQLQEFSWLAGNKGMEKKMETTITGYIGATMRIHSCLNPNPNPIMGYKGTTIRIHSGIPRKPKANFVGVRRSLGVSDDSCTDEPTQARQQEAPMKISPGISVGRSWWMLGYPRLQMAQCRYHL